MIDDILKFDGTGIHGSRLNEIGLNFLMETEIQDTSMNFNQKIARESQSQFDFYGEELHVDFVSGVLQYFDNAMDSFWKQIKNSISFIGGLVTFFGPIIVLGSWGLSQLKNIFVYGLSRRAWTRARRLYLSMKYWLLEWLHILGKINPFFLNDLMNV